MPVRQPYAGTNYIPLSGTMNWATGLCLVGKLSVKCILWQDGEMQGFDMLMDYWLMTHIRLMSCIRCRGFNNDSGRAETVLPTGKTIVNIIQKF
jgi:hypothetical protein